MTYRINRIATAGVILAQLAASVSTQSAIAGVITAGLLVVFLGPTQWEKQ